MDDESRTVTRDDKHLRPRTIQQMNIRCEKMKTKATEKAHVPSFP